jgi:hypothetical protein
MGRKGIRVKRKMMAGGMAITKLKEMADARSVIPTVFTCPKKNMITSYRAIPLKPGRNVFLLKLTR